MDNFEWLWDEKNICGNCRHFKEYYIKIDSEYYPTEEGRCQLRKNLKFNPLRKKEAQSCCQWKPEPKDES